MTNFQLNKNENNKMKHSQIMMTLTNIVLRL